MVKDVVCGMEVDPADAPAKMEYAGALYYFCSEECKAAFSDDPDCYAGASGSEARSGSRTR
jgi:YHS domain-containing protein